MMNHQINIGFETEVADENSVRKLIAPAPSAC